jgi:pilus assembly protein Flp/PilA
MLSRITSGAADFLKSEDGPTAVEYAVMLALILVVCITAIATVGSKTNAAFGTAGSQMGATAS